MEKITFDELKKIIESFRDEISPPFKKYEDTYIDGWTDACNEIMSAICETYEIE